MALFLFGVILKKCYTLSRNMKESWTIFGHQYVKNILSKHLNSGSFAHAYLFSGSAGLGKRALALELAAKILGTVNLSSHPDFLLLDAAGEISIEQAQEFLERLHLKPFVAKKKIAIINHAQFLNTASSNALLKTLEEPSASTVIILIAEGKVLATIASRCQCFNFNAFSQSQMAAFALKKGFKVSPQQIALSFGSPARLNKLVQDAEFLKNQQQLIDDWYKLAATTFAEKIAAVSDYGTKESDELFQTFGIWLLWQSKNQPEAKKLNALLEALKGLKANLNKKMVLQGLFLKI